MAKQNAVTILVHGAQSMKKLENIAGYELLDLKAGIYHKFIFDNGVILYLNDFGIKTVTVVPAGVKDYDIQQL